MPLARPAARFLATALALSLSAAAGIFAQTAASQALDGDFAKSVREWTTRPEFISPLVDHLPKSGAVPSPKDALGHHIGEPRRLTYYEDILKYYRAMAAKSRRVRVISIGQTDEGRELVVVFVGSDDSIRNLEQYRTYLGQLADPRRLSDAQARNVITKAKPIYHLMGGLHSGEVGPPEMLMELAYRLITDDSPLVQQIRENVIVSITPVADPDGRDRNVDWYYKYGINETEARPVGAGVPYWGKYVFHDNNRDINYSQMSMRALLDWYLQWHPPIVHDLHQAQALLYTFSGQAPQNPNLDPILYGELPMMANFEVAQFAKYGMPGVWTHGYVDMWSPGYLAFMSSNHNGMIRMYEIQGFSGANTRRLRLNPSSGAGQGDSTSGPGSVTRREWYRPWPANGDFEWSLRNTVNYAETGVLTALQYTSQFSRIILENFYQKSRNSVDSGRKETVAGYVIPVQRDMTRIATVVNLLRMQAIEVGRAASEIQLKEGTFPAGSFVIKRDQPYARLAKILLEKQVYPDPNLRTYDDAAWTMGLMSRIEVKEIADKAILDVAVEPVEEVKPAGTLAGSGSLVGVAHYGSNNMIALRYRLKEMRVRTNEREFTDGGVTFPPGSFVVSGDAAKVRVAVEALGLTASALTAEPTVPLHDLDLPRVAVYSTWGSTQDVGWVRYAFDKFEVRYEHIYKERVRAGHLRDDYDVVVIPHQAGTAKRLVFDIEGRGTPLEYRKSDRFRYLGAYGESDDITGGMGLPGVAEVDKFVKDGGLLVTLGTASFFSAEFGLTPRVDAARTTTQFYAPGPIVEAEILQPQHPIFYGYAQQIVPVRYASGPLLSVQADPTPSEAGEETSATPRTPASVLMRYPGGDDHVLSGFMRGANEIRNRPAIVEQESGKGRVILFAGNPCYRWQNFGEFNMLFNTLLNFNDLNIDSSHRTHGNAELR